MKPSRRFNSRYQRAAILGLALICVALVVHEIFGQHGYLALQKQRREHDALQQQIQQLQKENQQLQTQIKSLKTDPKAIEKVAREQMGLARPGEIIYSLPDKHAQNNPSSSTSKDTPPKQSR